ncbi:DUF559 domain-containing protein [Shewanella sp. SR1]|uniref:endonuclease domain-containing protein n=1 Tax=Shewanella sp. SR1 TaxID=2855505 RepID=UPI001CF5B3F1|nr:DUF559 domain-containing protein [Shewanella sp. SR1]MCB2381152.1 DUF559 domain-containing protein [Shewanella sp. SR1]
MSTKVEKFIFNNTRTSHKRWESIVMYALHYTLRDVKFLSQYPVNQYYIDGYFPELKIAVEIDEPYHERTKEEDAIREAHIKSELNCEFVRINVNEPVYEQVDRLAEKIRALKPQKWEIKERTIRISSGEFSKEKINNLTAANAFEFLDNIQEEVEQLGVCLDTIETNPNTLPSNGMVSFNAVFGELMLTVFTRCSCKPKIIIGKYDSSTLQKLGICCSEPSKTKPPYWKIVDLDKQLTREECVSYLSNLARKFSQQ